jgi:hypothetical protein
VTFGTHAFSSCDALKTATANLLKATSVGQFAFYGCDGITKLYMPAILKLNSYYSFNSCSKLVEIDLPEATYIAHQVFISCTSLTTVKAPKLTSMSSYVFYGCSNLVTIDLPSLGAIPGYTFFNCSKLQHVTINQATSVGSYAFSGCSSLATLALPKVATVYANAFINCSKLTSLFFATPITSWAHSAMSGSTDTDKITLTLSPNQKAMTPSADKWIPAANNFDFSQNNFCGLYDDTPDTYADIK